MLRSSNLRSAPPNHTTVKGVGSVKQRLLDSGGGPWNLHLEVGDGLSGAGPVGIFCTAVCSVGMLGRSGIRPFIGPQNLVVIDH